MATSANFRAAELRCKCGCGFNGCTPALLAALEAFRAAVGKPVQVISAYRCKKHNKAQGGAPASQHVLGTAADIKVNGMTAAQLEAVARTIPEIRGIGRDDHQDDLHIDVREHHAIWCYDAKGKQCAYYKPEGATT